MLSFTVYCMCVCFLMGELLKNYSFYGDLKEFFFFSKTDLSKNEQTKIDSSISMLYFVAWYE